eukprot:508013_1
MFTMSALVVHISLVYCCLIKTKSYQMTTDYVMQPWITLNNTLPFRDDFICVGFDYDMNKDIITLFGGNYGRYRVCQYSIASNTTQCTKLNHNKYNIYCSPSNFVSVNKNMYLWDEIAGRFLVFDMVQNAFGDTLNQPVVSDNYRLVGCISTDGENIYLIGGYYNSQSLNSFDIFDIENNKWHSGHALNQAREYAACLYNQNNNNIYIFGGYDESDDYRNSIERSSSISNITFSKWIYTQSVLTQSISEISAYMPSHSNTIFIIGYNFCNIFYVKQDSISECTQFASLAHANGIYIEYLQRIYTFGGSEPPYVYENNIIQTTQLHPDFDIDLSQSSENVFIAQRVPILSLSKYGSYTFQLICEDLAINVTANITHYYNKEDQCLICDDINCCNCSVGILPKSAYFY